MNYKLRILIPTVLIPLTIITINNLNQNQDQQLQQNHQQASKGTTNGPLDINILLQQYKGFCVNGYDPSQLTESEKLQQFTKGPCQPVVLIPGVGATSLQVEIDCPILQKEEPEIFKSCGWSTCTNTIYDIFKKRPAPEYTVWIDDIISPDSIFQYSSNQYCLGNLLTLRYNESAPLTQKWVEPKGLRLTWRGNTKLTKNSSQCGKLGIMNISKSNTFNAYECQTQLFRDMIGLFEAMGYQSGITFQAIPYDFRKAMRYRNTHQAIQTSLTSLNNFTGKRSFIVTHSYGSLHALDALQKMEQTQKDQLVSGFINIGAPFLGGFKTVNNLISGDSTFLATFEHMSIGIQYASQQLISKSFTSFFDLYPKTTYERFKETPWMQDIQRRVQYDQGGQFNNTPLDFFPDRSQQCTTGKFLFRPTKNCTTGLFNAYNSTIVQIMNKDYMLTQESLQQLMEKETINIENPWTKYLESYQEDLHALVNPGVPTVIVYGAFAETGSKFIYNNDPKEYAQLKQFYFPDYIQSDPGDQSVLALSSLTAGIKWNYVINLSDPPPRPSYFKQEFQNKDKIENGSNFKPVKFFEMCSNYNQTFDIYDTNEKGEKKLINSGVYNGLDCSCLYSDNGNIDKCVHSCMITDPYYIKLVVTSLAANETSRYLKPGGMSWIDEYLNMLNMPKWSDEYLKQYVQDCTVLTEA